MKKLTLLLAIVAIAFGSCTVEKRHYMSGYHVDWHSRVAKADHNKKTENLDKENATALTSKSFDASTAFSTSSATLASTSELTAAPQVAVESKTEKVAKARKERKAAQVFQNIVTNNAHYNEISAEIALHTNAIQVANETSRVDEIVLILLAIFIPPLAVYLYEGSWTKRCTVNLILTLLCGIPGIIHALIVVLE